MSATPIQAGTSRNEQLRKAQVDCTKVCRSHSDRAGIRIAGAEFTVPSTRLCLNCCALPNSRSSKAQYPAIFCSEECEQEFIHSELADS